MKILALIGSYRKGGVIDLSIDEVLAAARDAGAETEKIYLIDKHIEFCTNCRTCTQQAGERRGTCPQNDEMAALLDAIEASDGIVLGSPMNFWTVTAVTKRFIERLVCFAYWPWGKPAPKTRKLQKDKRAVIVASSAAPALLARPLTKLVRLLKEVAGLLGANVVGVLYIGLAAGEQHPVLRKRTKRRAHRLGRALAGVPR